MAIIEAFKQFVKRIYDRVFETDVLDAAAAIAYYALFSFFPLILFIVAFNASFLKSAAVQEQVLTFAENYMPGSEDLVRANIQHLIYSSGAVGLLGTVVLLWSATLVFASFSRNINLAWTNATSRHFLTERLIGLMMIGILIIFLITSLIFSTVLDIVPRFFPGLFGTFFRELSRAHQFLIGYLPLIAIFGLFIVMYRYVPNVKVRWRESFGGAVFAVLALELTKKVFIWYLSLGTSSYQLIYGSLGAVVAFMLWIYISSFIVLLGGHVCAAIAWQFRPHEILNIAAGKDDQEADPVASPS